jgi:hypothetical protein
MLQLRPGNRSLREKKYSKYALALGGLVALASTDIALTSESSAPFVRDGKAGFVVSHMEYALGKDAGESGACPEGMTEGMRRDGLAGYVGPGGNAARSEQRSTESVGTPPTASPPRSAASPPAGAPDAQRAQGASVDEAERQFIRAMSDTTRANPCMNPEQFGPDPNYRTVKVPDVKAFGIDLDGQASRAKGKPAPGTCAHDDLLGMNGERGIDNQFYRLVGCNKAYQSTGPANGWSTEMYTGAWGVLITLAGVDDIRNDDSVEVTFVANGDPIELSPNREALENATYAMDQDPRFRARTHGRIKDGVLTTDPVDIRLHKITNSIYLERTLKEARAQMTLSKEGVLEGYLAGYTPVEDLYNFEYAFRNGKNGKGEPADHRLIMVSAMGRSATLTYTCNGAYHAMHELADGDLDPATGKCASISTQYRIKAIPAFVVDAKTKSANDDLER